MFWSNVTYSDCKSWIVLSVLRHVKQCKAVYSVKRKTKANLSRKHWLNYWHRCNNRCKSRLMHEIDALALNITHTTVYAHTIIACDGLKILMCAKSVNIINARFTVQICLDYVVEL